MSDGFGRHLPPVNRLPPADNIPPPDSSCLTLPSPLSAMEATYCYAGLYSAPILVARSSTTPWVAPSGPNAEWDLKELGPAGHHPLKEAWEGGLAKEVIALLDSMKVKWTTLNALRIGPGEYNDPIVVWIGVLPKSLCGNDGKAVVSKCMDLLEKHNLTDVEVEICELMVTNMFYTSPSHKKRHKLCKHARRAARRAEAEPAVVDCF